MPQIRKSSSPANPSCNPEITGTPPATDAPNWICRFIWRARLINSGPQCAINCLLAVTTDLPEVSARLIQSSLGSRPPITSTTTSAFDDEMSSIFSVQCAEEGSQSTFFRATLRFRTWVRRRWVFARSQRIFATELPTVPKPTRATLQFCGAEFFLPTAALLPVALRLVGPVIIPLSPKRNGGCIALRRTPNPRTGRAEGHRRTPALFPVGEFQKPGVSWA